MSDSIHSVTPQQFRNAKKILKNHVEFLKPQIKKLTPKEKKIMKEYKEEIYYEFLGEVNCSIPGWRETEDRLFKEICLKLPGLAQRAHIYDDEPLYKKYVHNCELLSILNTGCPDDDEQVKIIVSNLV